MQRDEYRNPIDRPLYEERRPRFGNVKALRNGKLSIEAARTTLDVPVTRVKEVELASQKALNPATNTNTVRAFFNSASGSMTFDLRKWTNEELKAESANFDS